MRLSRFDRGRFRDGKNRGRFAAKDARLAGFGGGAAPGPTLEAWVGAQIATDKAVLLNGVWYVGECDADPSYAIQRHNTYDQVRFEVRNGDQWASDSSSVNRSELDGFPLEFPKSVALWGAYSFAIEPGVAGNPDAYIGQLHQTAETGYTAPDPPLAFHLLGTTLHVRTRTDNGSPPAGNPSGVSRYSFTPTRGRWYNVVFKITIDPAGSGALEVWIDGTKVVNLSGIATGYNAAGNYWKIGVYRTAETATFAIRYANVEFGTADLTARIASPKALTTAKAAVPATPLDGLTITAAYSASRALFAAFNGYPMVGVNNALASFRDQVGTKHITASGSARPALATVNGRLVADFDGGDDIMSAGSVWTNFLAVAAGYVCISVYPDTIDSNQANVYENHCLFGDSGDFLGLFLKTGANAFAYNYDGTVDSPTGIAITAGAPHTVEWRHTGGNLSCRVDGGSWQTAASGNTSGTSGTLNIGGNVNAAASQGYNGKIGEMVFCQTVPSTQNQDNIRAALATHLGGT